MKLIIWLTFGFIAFELLKLFILKTYWNLSINRDKRHFVAVIEFIYFVFLVGLFFTPYWYIGIGVLIVSIVTAFQVMDDFMEMTKFNKQIRNYISTDAIVSIILLLVIIFKELIQ